MSEPLRSASPRLDPAWRRHVPRAWQEGWEPVDVPLLRGSTEVVTLGAGPPLLLLPPLPGWKEAWLACARRLARRFRVVAPDLPARRGPSAWSELTRDVERLADAFAPGRVGVVGHSLGGALAQRWALRQPGRVAALVLSSTFARVRTPPADLPRRFVEQPLVLAAQRWLPAPAARALARRWAAASRWVYDPACDDATLELVRLAVRGVPLRLAAERVRLALRHDLRAELPALACPTLVVRGEREGRFAREAAAELVRLVPGAASGVSPGAGHLHLLSRPDWLCAAIEAWVAPRLGAL